MSRRRDLTRLMSALARANQFLAAVTRRAVRLTLSLTLSLATGCDFKQVERKRSWRILRSDRDVLKQPMRRPREDDRRNRRAGQHEEMRENGVDHDGGKQIAAKIGPSWYRLIGYNTVCISTAT